MKLTRSEKITVDFYDSNAASWSKGHSDKNYWKDEFKIFKKFLPQGKILEVGCGGGRDAEVLISLGYGYIGTDISEGLLRVAKKRIPKAKFLKQDIYDLDFPKDFFDGFWSSAVFLHIPKSKTARALKNVHKIIKPNGIGLISVKQGIGEKLTDEGEEEWKGHMRFWSLYSLDEFERVLLNNSYEIIESYRKPISEKTTWLIYFVKAIK